MNSTLFHIAADGTFAEMRSQPYDNEDHIQRLLADYPGVLGGDQYVGDQPRRWALVQREIPISDGNANERRWSLDHLYVDQDAIPTLVEVKRSRDTRSRREVVGQMFDYAANGPAYWTVDQLRDAFAATHKAVSEDPGEALRQLLGDDIEAHSFWERVENNLREGKIRMIFLVDEMPAELLRIVEFLASQLRNAEVYAVEVRQHVGATGRVLATSVLGQAQNDVGKISRARDAVSLSEQEWFGRFREMHGAEAADVAEKIANWTEARGFERFVTTARSPSLGFKLPADGRHRYPLFILGNGKAGIPLAYLKYSPAFESDASRQKVVDDFRQVGFSFKVSTLAGDIRIPVADLTDEARLQQFLGALERTIAKFSPAVG